MGGYCEAGICRVGCRETQDCREGVCLFGACVPCMEDRECPGNRCVAGTCLPCEDSGDCPVEFSCLEGACLFTARFCGNGTLDPGEGCDEGPANADLPNALCRTDCTPGRCGDGIVDTPLELCDDGNLAPGDGCSPLCLAERTAPSETLPATVIELPFAPPSSSISLLPPLATIAPASPLPPQTSDTGPAALLLMIGGAAAGWAWTRRK